MTRQEILAEAALAPLRLFVPKADFSSLRTGRRVLFTGWLLTGRDAAHMRLADMLSKGEPLPVSLEGETIYYTGPCPALPGQAIGSCGPTTSSRMDPMTPALLDAGLIGMIGKGARYGSVREKIMEKSAAYFAATGGAGALLSRCITKCECAAFPELGTEAIYRIYAENFPAIVALDPNGTSIYDF